MATYTWTKNGNNAHAFVTLQDGAASGNGNTLNVNGSVRQLGFHVEFSAGCSAGVVSLETASSPSFTGTWACFAALNYVANGAYQVGVDECVMAVRARISTPIVGGTVTVLVGGN